MKRNYGIDLLRIVAMLFVIVLHITGVGGLCSGAEYLSFQYLLAQFLRMATLCAVNCYALISGYVGWDRQPKLSGLLLLWLKVIGFCLVLTAVSALTFRESLGWIDWIRPFFPVFFNQYWYFSSYVGLFLLMPLLNHCVRATPRKTLERVLVIALCGVYPLSLKTDPFLVYTGYSTLWLCLLYLAGAYFGRYDLGKLFSRKQWAMGFLLSVMALYLPRMLALFLLRSRLTLEGSNLMVQYTSPTVVLCAVALLGLFSRLRLSEGAIRVVSRLSPHAFGVYLLHVHPLVFSAAITDRFTWLGEKSTAVLVLTLLGSTLLIYALGTAADWMLTRLLKLLKIDHLLKKLDRFFP